MATWRDFDLSMGVHPVTHGLVMLTDLKSIFQSINCLIKTTAGEFLYSDAGAGIDHMLFELNNTLGRANLSSRIKTTLTQCESRIELEDVLVEADDSDPHQVNVTITFYILNQPTVQTTVVHLNRLR